MRKAIVIIAALLVLGVGGIFAVNKSEWNLFKKDSSQVSDTIENDEVKTINPVTDDPQIKAIKMEWDGHDDELVFMYVEKEGRIEILQPKDLNQKYQIMKWPNKNKAIIEYEGSLYTVDIESESIEKLLDDQYGDLTFHEMREWNDENNSNVDNFIWWGTRASVSPDGKTLVFNTNRSGSEEVWVKDLINGKEAPLLQTAINVEGWINNEEFIGTSFSEILRVETKTGQTKSYGEGTVATVESYMVIQKNLGSIEVHHFKDGTIQYFKDEINSISRFALIDDGSWIALLNMPDPTKPKYELAFIQLEKQEIKKVDIPDSDIVYDLHWKDHNTLILGVTDGKKDKHKETSIKVDEL